MKDLKKKKLKAKGWTVGSAAEFLGLTAEEAEYVQIKFMLADLLVKKRHHENYTQTDFANRIGSSQSRVANMSCRKLVAKFVANVSRISLQPVFLLMSYPL